MTVPGTTPRWAAMAALWVVVVAGVWIAGVQLLMVLFAPVGQWQRPGIAKVEVRRLERDTDGKLTGDVQVMQGELERELHMDKAAVAGLSVNEEYWILDNYYASPFRPEQFRLSPWRLLVEYPEPFILLALWAILRLRRAQAKAVEAAPVPERKVWRDEFHLKAERFSGMEKPEKKDSD